MRDHQKSLFPGAAEKGCFFHRFHGSFFNVSCLSFMAVSEHKDVALLSNSCIVPKCGPALSQNAIGQTAQFRLDECSFGKNKSS